jgi:N-ethylmaleimide reductase
VTSLFTPVSLGALDLPNPVIVAPLTRARAPEDHVPTQLMANYFAQRADCGLIVSEATAVDPQGTGWYPAPGIWNEEMVAGWRLVTDVVHNAGGGIVAQLWHMGRLVVPDFIEGNLPIGPSAIAGEGEIFAPRPADDDSLMLQMKPYVVPRAMT